MINLSSVLESRDLVPPYQPKTDLCLCIIEDKYTDFTDDLAEALRNQKLNIVVDYSYKKIGDQIKKADKKQIPFVICIGEDEVAKDEFVLKRLVDGKELNAKREEIAKLIADSR